MKKEVGKFKYRLKERQDVLVHIVTMTNSLAKDNVLYANDSIRGICYGCGSPDHITSNCSQNKGNNNQRMMTEKGNRLGDEKAETKRIKG
uniref:CCHC-type domain-containing protein n=1 Tax=Lactuca sativa TaxID=4236 RepID=A0A9R1X7H8_LACSA|nr:hypothetical protein LSAT_V11C600336980 [Lactuca sativa]